MGHTYMSIAIQTHHRRFLFRFVGYKAAYQISIYIITKGETPFYIKLPLKGLSIAEMIFYPLTYLNDHHFLYVKIISFCFLQKFSKPVSAIRLGLPTFEMPS